MEGTNRVEGQTELKTGNQWTETDSQREREKIQSERADKGQMQRQRNGCWL